LKISILILIITQQPPCYATSFCLLKNYCCVAIKSELKDFDGKKGLAILEPNLTPHMLSGSVANNIRLGYTGGAVDMYIPINDYKNGELVYCYDINSLYPSVMLNKPIPVGNPTFFNGNILKNKINDPFGFFYCRINSPKYLEHPIIQTHVKTNDGLRTIAPLGT
jgi:hypothetical protein